MKSALCKSWILMSLLGWWLGGVVLGVNSFNIQELSATDKILNWGADQASRNWTRTFWHSGNQNKCIAHWDLHSIWWGGPQTFSLISFDPKLRNQCQNSISVVSPQPELIKTFTLNTKSTITPVKRGIATLLSSITLMSTQTQTQRTVGIHPIA